MTAKQRIQKLKIRFGAVKLAIELASLNEWSHDEISDLIKELHSLSRQIDELEAD